MLRLCLIGLMLVAVLVVSAVAASMALAQPEFSEKGVKFTVKSGKTVLKATSGTITCQKDKSEGEISGVSTVSQPSIQLEECSGTISESKCPTTITTTQLVGELGSVAAEQAKSEVGLLFKPKEGTTLASFECGKTKVTLQGSVAGEVEFVSEASEQSNVIFTPSGTSMKIKTITTTKEEKPSLELNKAVATLESTETDNPTTKGIRVFLCLTAANAKYETLFKCKFGPAGGPFPNAWERFFLW